MLRLILLSAACAVVFAGFAAPFFIPGTVGLLTGLAILLVGSLAVWIIESRTRKLLRVDNAFNRLMKADGDSLIHRDEKK